MRILLVSTKDYLGGASIAMLRLANLLRTMDGFQVYVLVGEKFTQESYVSGPTTSVEKFWYYLHRALDYLPLKLFRKKGSLQWLPNFHTVRKINDIKPDIVNLHFIQNGFISIGDIRRIKAKKIVWTIHDMWGILGVEHYAYDQNRHIRPVRKSLIDLEYINQKRKKRLWKRLNWTLHAPSQWLKQMVDESYTLGNHHCIAIRNPLDTEFFKPIEKKFPREIFGIKEGKPVILFGAVSASSDERKGFSVIKELINDTSKQWAAFGSSDFDDRIKSLGILFDQQSLFLAYNSADIFVAPSLLDNLPNTVVESISCGTPVVAFDVGGISDIVDHKKNGYLAKSGDIDDLKNGISWCLENQVSAARAAREKAETCFSYSSLASKYVDALFNLDNS